MLKPRLLVYSAWLESVFGSMRLIYVKTNPGWLELPSAGTNSHGPKHIRATDVLLYTTEFLQVGVTLKASLYSRTEYFIYRIYHRCPLQTETPQPEGHLIMPGTKFINPQDGT